MEDGINLTGEVLHQKWTRFADLADVPEDEQLGLSDGWLTKFKARHRLKNIKWHGEGASANSAAIAQDRQQIQKLIMELGYELKNTFNADESDLFYVYIPFSQIISPLIVHTVFHQIGDYQTRTSLELRVRR